MKAAVVTTFSEALTMEDRLVPEPRVGQVLVHPEACGLCHTDIHAANGDWPVKPTLPLVPGHEGVGIVEKLGGALRALYSTTALPSPGSDSPVAGAGTASTGARPSANDSWTAAIRLTVPSPNTPWGLLASQPLCPMASRQLMLRF